MIENGTGSGLFGPGSAVWKVNGSLTSLVGGIQALLLQLLHPGALAGVLDHSQFQHDPLGRLERTVEWLAVTTFGSTTAAEEAARRVNRLHARVRGQYLGADEAQLEYSAEDPHLARWVHVAFTQALLSTHMQWSRLTEDEADRYVAEWGLAAELMGVDDPPTSTTELMAALADYTSDLRYDERAAAVALFLRKPPLPFAYRLVYPVLFNGAVATMPPSFQRALGLRQPKWRTVPLTAGLLAVGAVVLGRSSPSERAALRRIEQSGRRASTARV